MAGPRDAIPSLSEVQCRICMDILIKPVTLPCSHTTCNSCFQTIIEKSNLCCPFCRRRLSSWARHHNARNTHVNMELWETIQRYYPNECKLALAGQVAGGSGSDIQPAALVSEAEAPDRARGHAAAAGCGRGKPHEVPVRKQPQRRRQRARGGRGRGMRRQRAGRGRLARQAGVGTDDPRGGHDPTSPGCSGAADDVTTVPKKRRGK